MGEPGVLRVSDGDSDKQIEYLNFLQIAIEHTSQPFATTHADGRMMDCNKAFCDMVGFTKEELKAMTWSVDLTPPEWRELEARILERQNLSTGHIRYEKEYYHKDGSRIPVELNTHTLFSKSGSPLYYYTFFNDLTERKMQEELTRNNEDTLRAIFENAGVGIVLCNIDGHFTRVNNKFCEITGYTPAELIKLNVLDITHHEDLSKESGLIDDVISGTLSTYTIEKRYVKKNGSIIWVTMTASAIRNINGNPVGAIGIIENITGRRQMDERLKELNSELKQRVDQFQVLFNLLPMGVGICEDRECSIVSANPTLADMLGVPVYMNVSKSAPENENTYRVFYHGHEVPPEELPMQLSAKKGVIIKDAEYDIIRPDGRTIKIFGHTVPLYDDNGCVRGSIGAFSDITDLKRKEKELQDTKVQAELYLDLMGHDINNMNQIAMGYLELASDIMDVEGVLSSEHKHLITKPIETLRYNSNLIGNVRKLQREKAGLYNSELIDLEKMLNDVIKQFTSISGRDVVINLNACPCIVKANELLGDVFQNLIGNAIKHSTGTLIINVRLEKTEHEGRPYCIVSVEDNGPGIQDEVKKKLFDRLSLENTRASGKGFGLCLIKLLVDDFNGIFRVEDRMAGDYRQGSRFIVMLPVAMSQ